MDILLLSAGIKASLRAAQTGIDLYAERAVNKAIFLPSIRLPDTTPLQQVSDFLNEVDNIPLRTQSPFVIGWDQASLSWTHANASNSLDCVAKMLESKSLNLLSESPSQQKNMLIGGRMIEQWRLDNQPPTAWSRIALTLVDIGVEFIGANPSVMGLDSKGEKLIIAFANELGRLIPNDVDDMGKRHDFENQVLSMFVRSSLAVLAENAHAVIDDKQVASIVSGVLQPIVIKMEHQDLSELIHYRELIASIIAPSSTAIMRLLANKTEDYLAEKFIDDKALSVVTQAFLHAATITEQSQNITAVFSKQGLSALLVAGLDVAIKHPHVFFDDQANIDKTQAMQTLLSKVASSVSANITNTLDKKLSTAIAIDVIATVGEHADTLLSLDKNKPWDQLAAVLVHDFTNELNASLLSDSRLTLFNNEQKQRLVHIVLSHISQSPSMLSKRAQTAHKVLQSCLAIIQHDNHLLLSNKDWLKFVQVLSQAALNNFERLFNQRIAQASERGSAHLNLLSATIVPLLERITLFNEQKTNLAWQADQVMHILTHTIQGLKGNISGLLSQPSVVNDMLDDLLQKIEREPDKWGSESIKQYLTASVKIAITKGVVS
jgi:hypothetical protein